MRGGSWNCTLNQYCPTLASNQENCSLGGGGLSIAKVNGDSVANDRAMRAASPHHAMGKLVLAQALHEGSLP
eukprot:2425218-Amphidinium_carterae.1